MGMDSSSIQHGFENREYRRDNRAAERFSTKNFEQFQGFLPLPSFTLALPSNTRTERKSKLDHESRVFREWEEEGPPSSPPPSRERFLSNEKFEEEKRKAHCRYLINFDRF